MYTGKPHFLFNKNRSKPVSGKKYQKLEKHYEMLLQKEKVEGLTAWVKNAKFMAESRMKRYGMKVPV